MLWRPKKFAATLDHSAIEVTSRGNFKNRDIYLSPRGLEILLRFPSLGLKRILKILQKAWLVMSFSTIFSCDSKKIHFVLDYILISHFLEAQYLVHLNVSEHLSGKPHLAYCVSLLGTQIASTLLVYQNCPIRRLLIFLFAKYIQSVDFYLVIERF